MGIKDAWSRQMERSRIVASYGVHSVTRDGNYRFMPDGKFKQDVRPVAGAVATYEPGTSSGGRMTATRVVSGAILAGPAGAIIGGLLRKDSTRGYITVTFATGEVVLLDGPLSDDAKMRDFVNKVNLASSNHAEANAP